nr:ribosome maturation factor RimP-like [Nerophis lumbriciformis]
MMNATYRETYQPVSANRLSAELEAEIAAVAQSCDCKLLHAEFHGNVLQVVLDHPDGTTLQHCEAVSRQLSPILDLNDFGGGKYLLEVSSPGLDRQLFSPEDYRRFRGHYVRLTYLGDEPSSRETAKQQTAGKRTVVGELRDFTDQFGGAAQITVADTGEQVDIPLSQIQTARLDLEQELALGPTGGRA